jgi:triosephosphate isomerase
VIIPKNSLKCDWEVELGVVIGKQAKYLSSPEEAATVCAKIREAIAEAHGTDVAAATRILYGGSVKAANVAGFLRSPEVDGVLVGGASLDVVEFSGIARFQKHIGV